MKKKCLLISTVAMLLSSLMLNSFGQNGTACYKPLAGTGQQVTPINNNVLCVSGGSECNFISNISNITDASTTNYAEITNTVSLISGNGVSVNDPANTYPAGYFAGYIVDVGSATLLRADVLSAFRLCTYNDGILQETSTNLTLAAATAIGTSPGRLYLNFKTTLPFDEVRLTFISVVSALTNFRIYYATAFDGNCGTLENNLICGDQIGGSGTIVSFNNGGSSTNVNLLSSITDAANIIDGNKNSFAVVTIPANLSATSYVGVLDEQKKYPAGGRAGFVISRPSLLSVDLLGSLRIQTLLFGEVQEESSSSSAVNISLLSGAGDRTAVSIVTTRPYNEVRLLIPVSASLGTLNIYYAFEEAPICGDCTDKIITSGIAPYNTATINNARTGEFGVLCVSIGSPAPTLTNATSVINADTLNDYAAYTFGTVSLLCGFSISVKMTSPIPGGAITGFVLSRPGGTLNAGILENTVIRTYRNNVLQNTSTNANILGLSLLSSAANSKSTVGFRAVNEFDEVQITFTGLINLGVNSTIRVYYPFVIRDDDNDGTLNCNDQCPSGNDAIDTDSDGLTDCFTILPLTLQQFNASATNNRQVLLSWKTQSELNTSRFIVERNIAVNNADWKTIGSVAAAGNSSAIHNYSFTDPQPIDGINYYRLRMTDKDGKETISPIRVVNFFSKALLAVNIYPNPVQAGQSIQVNALQSLKYRLTDKTGRTLQNGIINAGNSTITAPASTGIYLLDITDAKTGSEKETYKIVVQ